MVSGLLLEPSSPKTLPLAVCGLVPHMERPILAFQVDWSLSLIANPS